MLNFNPNDTCVDANIPDDPNGTSNTPETPARPIPPRQMAVMPPEDDAFDPDEFLINYNKEFADGSPILFRDNII